MADKKPVVKKPSHKYASVYKVEGETLKRNNVSCPKCGPGVFLALHKNRRTCGKCGYMEKIMKKKD